MRSSELSRLSDQEMELVYKAPVLVCILIAGADGNIDDKEINKTLRMAKEQKWVHSVLSMFFLELATDFEEKLRVTILAYPHDREQRANQITSELSSLNQIWNKLSPDFSIAYYNMLKYFAHHVAASSGGFWGKIAPEEARLLELPMISNPSKN